MLTNALVAHGVALDYARLTGNTVCLWRRRRNDGEINTGLVKGQDGLEELPEGAVIYARYTALEAVKHMLRMSMYITWHDIAHASAAKDAAISGYSQAVWELEDGRGFFTCHVSIKLTNATRKEVVLVA